MLDLRGDVERLIKERAVELPTWPGVALELQRLVSGGNYGLAELTRLVESDQALAANTLRAANSAFYRGAAAVTTLPQAIGRIGASELSNIAIAGTLGLASAASGPLASLRKESWRRSLVDAALAQQLARPRGLEPGEAFLAGLLCDFGETIAYASFEAILERAGRVPAQPGEAWQREAEALAVELGMVLAEAWRLPPFIGEVVARHHDGDLTGCDHPGLVTLVTATAAVTRLVLAAPSAEAAALEGVAGLTGPERALVAQVLPTVPGLLQAFDEAAPATPAPAPSLVSSPSRTLLTEPIVAVDLPGAIAKKDRSEKYRVVALSPTGARLSGVTPQPERHLVSVEVGDLKLSATVRRCESTPSGVSIEVQPFAMDRAAQARWRELLLAAQRAPAPG